MNEWMDGWFQPLSRHLKVPIDTIHSTYLIVPQVWWQVITFTNNFLTLSNDLTAELSNYECLLRRLVPLFIPCKTKTTNPLMNNWIEKDRAIHSSLHLKVDTVSGASRSLHWSHSRHWTLLDGTTVPSLLKGLPMSYVPLNRIPYSM